ncbi:hypothetical protein [Methanobacterium sp.]|uniref:hypothetical protein n=1 Tax=Methanobacterium sp. TaxID=2164 RepID=UPI003C7293A9
MNKKYGLLEGKTIQKVEFDESGSELTITFTDNTRLWIEITEFTDNSMLEVVLFDENDEIIKTIHEGYKRS